MHGSPTLLWVKTFQLWYSISLQPSLLAHPVPMTVYNLCGQQTPAFAFMLVVSESVPLLQWWVPSRQAITHCAPLPCSVCTTATCKTWAGMCPCPIKRSVCPLGLEISWEILTLNPVRELRTHQPPLAYLFFPYGTGVELRALHMLGSALHLSSILNSKPEPQFRLQVGP